jgi:hypothetical protein
MRKGCGPRKKSLRAREIVALSGFYPHIGSKFVLTSICMPGEKDGPPARSCIGEGRDEPSNRERGRSCSRWSLFCPRSSFCYMISHRPLCEVPSSAGFPLDHFCKRRIKCFLRLFKPPGALSGGEMELRSNPFPFHIFPSTP